MERTELSALGAMIDDVRRAWGGIGEIQQRMLAVTGTAWSEDRLIKVVVGPRGQVLELEIDPRVYRRPDSVALARTIMATIRVAVDEASAKSATILGDTMPGRDLKIGEIGGMDLDNMLRSHDSDLRPEGDRDV